MKRSFTNLFILSYGALGDFCILLYFLEHAHRGAPEARYVVLTTRGAPLLREMAAAYPFVEIVTISPLPLFILFLQTVFRKNIFIVPPTFFDVPAFVGRVAQLLTFFRGTVIGFSSRARTPKFDLTVPFNTKDLFYKNFAALLTTLELSSEDSLTITFFQDTSILSSLGEDYIVIAPFASNPSKSLPPKRWVDLLAFLGRNYTNQVIILGAPSDKEAAGNLIQQSGHTNVQALCGLPFAQTAAIIAHTKCFIGIDSGLTHIAGVQGVRTVALEHRRAPMWWPSYNQNAIILVEPKNCLCDDDFGKDCYWIIDGIKYLRCLVDIPQERIEGIVSNILQQHD